MSLNKNWYTEKTFLTCFSKRKKQVCRIMILSVCVCVSLSQFDSVGRFSRNLKRHGTINNHFLSFSSICSPAPPSLQSSSFLPSSPSYASSSSPLSSVASPLYYYLSFSSHFPENSSGTWSIHVWFQGLLSGGRKIVKEQNFGRELGQRNIRAEVR